MKPFSRLILSIVVALLLFALVRLCRAQVIEGNGIEARYCQEILNRVEAMAPVKAHGAVRVTVEEKTLQLPGIVRMTGYPVLGLYEQDRRMVTVNRQFLCPWLLAHELAHCVLCDNYDFHPETWANLIAEMAVGPRPEWLPREVEW